MSTTPLDLGLVHTPVTPFTDDHRVDYESYGRLLDFHLDNAADFLSLPMHVGESVSLSDRERRELLEFALRHVDGRAPIIAHASQSGTALAAALARHAEEAGAAAIIATTPYYWTPAPAMMLEHFKQIGSAVAIPYYVYNTPQEMEGTRVTTDLTLKLLDQLPNFAGVVDASLDWQFMIDVVSTARRTRADFQLVSGSEYLISAGAIGARGAFAPLAGVAPGAVRALYELCREERYGDALPRQQEIAELRRTVRCVGVAGLKEAMLAMGRDCGTVRPPVQPLSEADRGALKAALGAMPGLRKERPGW